MRIQTQLTTNNQTIHIKFVAQMRRDWNILVVQSKVTIPTCQSNQVSISINARSSNNNNETYFCSRNPRYQILELLPRIYDDRALIFPENMNNHQHENSHEFCFYRKKFHPSIQKSVTKFYQSDSLYWSKKLLRNIKSQAR